MQKTIPFGSKPIAPPTIVEKPKTLAFGSAPIATPAPTIESKLASQDTGFFSGLGARTAQEQVAGAKKIAESAKKGFEISMNGNNVGQSFKGAARTIFGTASGAAQVAFAPVTAVASPIVEKVAVPAFQAGLPVVKQIAKAAFPTASKVAEKVAPSIANVVKNNIAPKVQNTVEKNPESTKLVGDIIDTALLFTGGAAKKPVQNIIKKELVPSLEKTIANVGEKTTMDKVREGIINKAEKLYTKKLNLREGQTRIQAQSGQSVERFLAEKPELAKLIKREGKNFNTENVTEAIAKEVAPKQAQLRELVKAQGKSVSLDEYKTNAIKNAEKVYGNSKVMLADAKDTIAKHVDALRKEWGDIVPLENLTDIKTENWALSRFDKAMQRTDEFRNAQRALGKSAQQLIEKNVTDANVNALNKELGSYYNAIDRLEFLHGKKVPGGRLGGMFNRMTGAVLGSGGGVLGSIVGATTADGIATALSDVPESMVRRAQKIFKARGKESLFNDALAKIEQAKARRMLPAPKPGTPTISNYIPMQLSDNAGKSATEVGLDATRMAEMGNPAIKTPKTNNTSIQRRSRYTKQIMNAQAIQKELEQAGKPLPTIQMGKVPKKKVNIPTVSADTAPNVIEPVGSRYAKTGNVANMPEVKIPNTQKTSRYTKIINAVTKNQKGFISTGFKNEGELTTKILKDLEGKTTVSKQYILDATNRGELKQAERDITREILDTMKGDTINVQEFADKVKSELLPLKVVKSPNAGYKDTRLYENISLPDELRGNVKNYDERVYQSPISTSAGGTHFSYLEGVPGMEPKNYFGHTRIEDMADNKTRRVIEVQSDLYQKGKLEREIEGAKGAVLNRAKISEVMTPEDLKKYNKNWKITEDYYDKKIGKPEDTIKANSEIQQLEKKYTAVLNEERVKSKQKLQQYNDPTAHFRMIREEIKKASQDGKTKLQFPTGETAMKVEGLGETESFELLGKPNASGRYSSGKTLTPSNMKVGAEILGRSEDEWVITDVMGDGKFRAMPKRQYEDNFKELLGKGNKPKDIPGLMSLRSNEGEVFDISGKVDTNNPIYKFYEKDVQKYLNKYGGKKVIDSKGVSWIEIPITKEQGKAPVEAFGKTQAGVLFPVAGATAAGVAVAAKIKQRYSN